MVMYEFFLTSSLEKVFPNVKPSQLSSDTVLSAWRSTRAAVQLVYTTDSTSPGMPVQAFQVSVAGGPCPAYLRKVELVPSDYPCYETSDSNYITKKPGLFPDLLAPVTDAYITPIPHQYRSLWISWNIPEDIIPGDYEITITACAQEDMCLPNGVVLHNAEASKQVYVSSFTLRVAKALLPAQKLLHTEWFHADCLASYYGVAPLSDEHWRIIERFIHAAGREHGINMLLTPVFTPPLDTAVGGERLTVQLVGISCVKGKYTFDFTQLARWAKLCKQNGIDYLEIAHLFTQWGAHATPKIMANVDGVYKRIFGWDVPADSPDYREFLEAFLPALQAEIALLGYDKEHVYYHISDEPSEDHLSSYQAAKAQTADLLEGCQVIDALSNFAFYSEGLVKQPIPANDHIQPFIDAKVPDLWVYYCCVQSTDVPNRFFAMPSARNRIMGMLMYLYNIKGFLHWGYNFYNSKYSLYPVDPYRVTHAGYAFPSGDPFLVYPGADGTPLSSIRAEVQDEALYDLRALCHLESLAGREFVERLIYEDTNLKLITFKDYPHNAEYLLALREKVAAAIDERENSCKHTAD